MSIHNDAGITSITKVEEEGHGADDLTRKRKREDELQCSIDRRPFMIRTNSTDPFAKPRTFTPLCLLSRSKLPLAYLDTVQGGSRIFAAHVQILETCHEFQDEANVLVVEDEGEGRLYAVERVQWRRYALCRLGSWVKTDDVERQSITDVRPDKAPRKRHDAKSEESNRPWWMSAAADVSKDDFAIGGMRGPVPKITMQRPSIHIEEGELLIQPGDARMPKPDQLASADLHDNKEPSPEGVLEELAKHYLDALYLSRTTLAYFTKGPLARARTALTATPTELVTFLRGAILPSSVMDKKFREVIAEHVKEMPTCDLEASATKSKSKRKRKWKQKRDRSGFFVDEKDYVEQWWQRDNDPGASPNATESMEAALKMRSSRLRNRETFLQIILILETMALEASLPVTELPAAAETQGEDSQAPDSQAMAGEKKSRKKKEVDISGILESLIDRLCIWYSLETTSPVKTGENGSGDSKEDSSDDLKTFCTEVILPFYGGRIPDRAILTSKKLGGPSLPNPASKRAAAASRKPGEPAVRQAPEKKPRKPLARVSTDTLNNVGKRMPGLHRSVTDSAALSPLIKQEDIELPHSLDRIPLAKAKSQQDVRSIPKSRVSLLHQVSLNKREVDLSAMSQANEEKKRKKAKVQEQIRDAITALKKPNRALAVEEIAKHADESFAKAVARGRTATSNNPQRKVADKTSIAVTATPRHIKATPLPRRRTERASDEKSTQLVPSSSTRLFAGRSLDAVPSSTFAIPQSTQKPSHRTTNSVEETPSRGFARFMPAGLVRPPGTLLESPTVSRTTGPMMETPLKSIRMPKLIHETPKMKQPVELSEELQVSPGLVAASPDVGGGSAGKSIYAALGWEDEYEELS